MIDVRPAVRARPVGLRGSPSSARYASYYDANGHYARVSTAEANLFHYCTAGDTNPLSGAAAVHDRPLEPIPPSQQFNDLQFGTFTRCPGGATQPISGSNPFLTTAATSNGKCDPSDVPPGP